MSIQAVKSAPDIRRSVSEAEWRARVELAAAYRLLDHLGITDMAHNHLTLRVPDEPDAFLMKSPGAFFEEVTASRIEKYDLKGNPRQEGLDKLHGGGAFHAAILAARPDINATIHTHTPANIGVSSQTHGLLPLSQHALRFMGKINYHDYGGLEADPALIPALVQALGDKRIAILRNHGVLVCGRGLGEAFVAHHNLEMACRNQVAALSAGIDKLHMISKGALDYTMAQWNAGDNRRFDGGKDWQGYLRRANRLFADLQD